MLSVSSSGKEVGSKRELIFSDKKKISHSLEKFDEANDWIQNTVYAGYEGTEGLIGGLGASVDGKVVTLSNWESKEALDASQEKFQEIMTSEEMKAWDTKHNCVDVVYAMDKQ